MSIRRLGGATAATVSIATIGLLTTPTAHALDDCGVGMDYNYQTQQCEPWAPVNVNNIYNPEIPVPIPNFNVVPDIGVGVNVGLPRIDPVAPALRGVDAPLHDVPHDAPIHDVPHAAPIHGGGRR